MKPGAHFTQNFMLVIQIRWKFHFAVVQFLTIESLQSFLYAATQQ